MPRPKTHVTLTLPPDVYATLAERADANGEPIETYLVRYLTRAAETHRTRISTPQPAQPAPIQSYWKKSMKQPPNHETNT